MGDMKTTVEVTGGTEWTSETSKRVRRFRGSTSVTVAVKDPVTGKPARMAQRTVKIVVRCDDGVEYVFDHWTDLDGDGSRSIQIHGRRYSVDHYQAFPEHVEHAHHVTVRRLRVCAGITRTQYAALTTYRPINVKVAFKARVSS